jgi:hypothetical protein
MNNVRQVCKKTHLANKSANCSQIVHEQCSKELQKVSFGEHIGELLANISPNYSQKRAAVFGIENRK